MSKPVSLSRASRVGVFAPSSRLALDYPQRFARGVQALGSLFSGGVAVPPVLEDGEPERAGSAELRVSNFLSLLADPEVDGILTTVGGFNANDMLSLLPASLAEHTPKVLVGYSDTTALLLGYQALTGSVVFYGPAVMPQLGELPEPFAYTTAELLRIVCGEYGPWVYPDEEADEAVPWEEDRPRRRRRASTPVVLREGAGTGPLYGGNVDTLNFLLGTRFLKAPARPLIFLEATADNAEGPRWRRSLVHLRDSGLMAGAAGLLIGRFPDTVDNRAAWAIVLDVFRDTGFPIAAQLPFGHVDPMTTIPVGGRASILCKDGHVEWTLAEPCVA